MEVVVLRTTLDYRAKFIFKSMEDCEKFKHVFKDHFCNVPWNTPTIVDEQIFLGTDYKIISDPKKAAEDNLSWGFSLCKFHKISETEEQLSFVKNMIELAKK